MPKQDVEEYEITLNDDGYIASTKLVRATCAYCGATRPVSELEYCRPWINGERKPGFYCAERTHPGQFLPDCAGNAEASSEG